MAESLLATLCPNRYLARKASAETDCSVGEAAENPSSFRAHEPPRTSPVEVPKALSIRGLSKVYRNGLRAVKDINLDVEAGDFFALLGPNGAGKSTMIGIISSLVRKSGGTVRIFGHHLDRDRERAKRCLGLVPQEFNFSQFETVLNIVVNQAGYYGVPRREARVHAERLLRQLSLWDKRNAQSRTLSGGMKRRLMIARALAHRPRLLLLDEPTAGVDIEIRYSMWEFLKQINQEGTTIILTTHYLEEAEKLCRNIAIINHGQIIEHSTLSELLIKLRRERYLVEFRQPITKLPVIAGYAIEPVDHHTIGVDVSRERGLNPLFQACAELGLEIVSLRNAANRLEQLFIDLLESQKTKGPEGN